MGVWKTIENIQDGLDTVSIRAAGLNPNFNDFGTIPYLGRRLIVCSDFCKKRIIKHVSQEDKLEWGGLLIGYYVSESHCLKEGDYPIATRITDIVPAFDYVRQTSTLIDMGTAIWDEANKKIETLKSTPSLNFRYPYTKYVEPQIVGWYHSHPGFGAFFSEIDRQTQKVWRYNAQIALVIDVIKKEEAWYAGPHSDLIPPENVFTQNNLLS